MKKQAFTLVELIVVITILAILGTIGFISLQGFSSDARDSKRISEIGEIRNGLQIYQARNGLLPTPSEQLVTVGNGTTDFIIQGYAGESVLNEIKMNGNPKDPLDEDKYYTYSVNANKTKFQLLALLENDNNLTSFNTLNIIPTTHASYLNRYPYSIGSTVGVLLDEATNRPLQELTTSINLNTDTNNYKVVFSDNNEVLTLSGEFLYTEIREQTNNNGVVQTLPTSTITASTITQNLCTISGQIIYTDSNGVEIGRVNNTGTTTSGNPENLTCSGHIAVCSGNESGYVLKACNVGSSTVGATNNSASYGNYHQWGNNWGGASNATTSTELVSCTEDSTTYHNSFVMGESVMYNNMDWCNSQTDNIWGNTTSNFIAKKGPCDEGYHIPSQPDWTAIITSWNGGTNGTNLSNSLKLPLAGYRNWFSGSMSNENIEGFYWSYSPLSPNPHILHLNSNSITPNSTTNRASGGSVRCIKN